MRPRAKRVKSKSFLGKQGRSTTKTSKYRPKSPKKGTQPRKPVHPAKILTAAQQMVIQQRLAKKKYKPVRPKRPKLARQPRQKIMMSDEQLKAIRRKAKLLAKRGGKHKSPQISGKGRR